MISDGSSIRPVPGMIMGTDRVTAASLGSAGLSDKADLPVRLGDATATCSAPSGQVHTR